MYKVYNPYIIGAASVRPLTSILMDLLRWVGHWWWSVRFWYVFASTLGGLDLFYRYLVFVGFSWHSAISNLLQQSFRC